MLRVDDYAAGRARRHLVSNPRIWSQTMGWLRTFQPSRVYSALESYSSEHAVYDADRSACRELNVGQVFVRERKNFLLTPLSKL